MAVVQCDKGHFYDNEKFTVCPHCENPLPKKRKLSDVLTQYHPEEDFQSRAKREVQLGPVTYGDEKTVGIFKASLGRDPVVGWLVCTHGSEAGRDYRLHAGRNAIGRALHMDIALPDDAGVSRDNHCSLIYDHRHGSFVLVRGQGESVLINGSPLADTYSLTGEETIEIGASTFVFIPFCGKGREW